MKELLIALGSIMAVVGFGWLTLWAVAENGNRADGGYVQGDGLAMLSFVFGVIGVALIVLAERLL